MERVFGLKLAKIILGTERQVWDKEFDNGMHVYPWVCDLSNKSKGQGGRVL